MMRTMQNKEAKKSASTDPHALPVRLARRVIRFIDQLTDWFLLCLLLLMIAFGIYSLWDTHQVYQAASPTVLATYKPDTRPYLSFQKLHRMNPEVIGWVQVYGTKIDYPVAQADDNDKYLNTDAKGTFSLSGCPFLDSANAADFSDPNSIIYGHHMEKHMMFGDLDRFRKKKVFASHRYGDLYFGGRHYGLVIFAFIEGDAYDARIYNTEVRAAELRQYGSMLMQDAKYTRAVHLAAQDHIVLLSTCASGLTNKRYIVAAKRTKQTYKDTFGTAQTGKEGKPFWLTLPWWWYLLMLAAILLFIIWRLLRRRRKKAGGDQNMADNEGKGGV
ncbi:MAG: class B sortase [Eubacteriales bacterium]|nr:class B sortase [Eubacteriales bacterium]